MIKPFMIIGSAICHQKPERCLILDGSVFYICARCTGIYIGAALSFLFLGVWHRLGSSRFPKMQYVLVLSIFISLMIIDAMSSYTGLRETSNAIRLFSGLLEGISLPLLMVPLLNANRNIDNNSETITNFGELFFLALLSICIGFAVLHGIVNQYVVGFFSLAGLILVYWGANKLILDKMAFSPREFAGIGAGVLLLFEALTIVLVRQVSNF